MLKHVLLVAIWISSMSIVMGQKAPEAKAQAYLQKQAKEWNVTLDDVKNSAVSDMYTSEEGRTYIYFHQLKDGIPIRGAVTPVVITENGKVYSSGHRFIKDVASMPTNKSAQIDPQKALALAVEHLGLKTSEAVQLRRNHGAYIAAETDFADNEISIKPEYVYTDGTMKLGWAMDIDEKEDADYYNIVVDATDGSIIGKHNYTVYCQFDHDHSGTYGEEHTCSVHTAQNKNLVSTSNGASYNVFAFPVESPIHGKREVKTNPHVVDASPYGWHDTDGMEGAEYTITRGNNVHAHTDFKNEGTSPGTEPDGSSSLVFDFPFDPEADALQQEAISQVNLFYAVNRLHDVTYQLGFDEKSGNFQKNNYGKGGLGNDYVLAQAYDSFELEGDDQGLNNANFSTPPDGANGRMQMYLWENPTAAISVESPEEIKGFITTYGTSTSFGSTIPTADQAAIEGKVVLAYDGSAQDATTTCEEVVNKDEVSGNIAMVDRGLCTFVKKTENAQQAGAIAIIICNIVGAGGDGEETINMAGESDIANIPAVFFKKSDCDRIKATIRGGGEVQMKFQERGASSKKYLDGSLDNGVIAHEFGHGVSNRLIGGPSNSSCMNSEEQAGEGISDFMTLIMTVKEGDTREMAKGIGNYASARTVNDRGIRRYPYSSDMNVNPLTFGDLNNIDTSNRGFIYSVGAVWTSMLWEVFWNIVDVKGLDSSWKNEESGNFIAGRLVFEGMKMSPCNPSFIEARDAILKADEMLYDGAHSRLIWEGFAKRGLGFFATDEDGNSISDGVENFEINPLSIKELKIKKSVPGLVRAGQEVEVKLTVTNHIEQTVEGVKVEDQIPSNMTYVEGSASVDAEIVDGKLVIQAGDMAYKDEKVFTYKLMVNGDAKSQSIYYQNFEDFDKNSWDRESIEGTDVWRYTDDFARSGEYSWFVEEVATEIDQTLVTEALEVMGEQPILKFWHRYNTEPINDGGFVQISEDGRKTWETVQSTAFKRNGYNSGIAYGTFAIPSLEGYTGTTKNKYVDSYIDIAKYKGKTIHVRFRFGTNEENIAEGESPGWSIDDVEIIDLKADGTIACVTATNIDEGGCSSSQEILYESTAIISPTVDLVKGVEAFEVAPNPAQNYVSVSLLTTESTQGEIQLINALGQVVQSMRVETGVHPISRSFDVSGMNPGLYIVQYRTGAAVVSDKIIIQ